MSAAIVSYESFKAKREQRPQEYFAYIDLLQEAYPELIKAECEEAVDCPTEMIDQLGGWSANNVGSRYGAGYDLSLQRNAMKQLY